jgi:hypothetical protein
MSDKLTQAQETSIELSEQDLEAVAGGVAGGAIIGIDGFAQGELLADVNTLASTQAVAQGPATVSTGIGAVVSIGLDKPSFPKF